jgi:MarR family transcriptional regulator, organic hydroperoxide resistance regulator
MVPRTAKEVTLPPPMKPSATARAAWGAIIDLVSTGEAYDRLLEVSANAGLTVGLLRALQDLPADEGVPMGELAQRWRCDASYVTGVVNNLEARGFAERKPLANDRRVKLVVATTRGGEARDEAERLLAEPPPAIAALTQKEQRQLRDLLRKIVAASQATKPN